MQNSVVYTQLLLSVATSGGNISHNKIIYIAIATLVTFLIRVLPITLIRKQIKNKYIRSFLYYVPYVTIAVMTFPAIMDATDWPWAGLIALIVGIVAAWFGASMFQVAIGCCIVVFVLECFFVPNGPDGFWSTNIGTSSLEEIITPTAVIQETETNDNKKESNDNQVIDEGGSQMQNNIDLIIEYANQMIKSNSPTQKGEFTWDTERKTRSWTYYSGCMNDAFMKLYELDPEKNEAFYQWTKKFYDNLIADNGATLGKQYIAGELDSVACGKALFSVAKANEKAGAAEKYDETIAFIYGEICNQQNYPECGGNFIHKMNNNSWSHWNIALDGLYMAGTYLTEYVQYLDKQGKTAEADKIRAEVFNRLHWVAQNLRMENGLYTHAYCVADGTINGISWARSDGWYIMALVNAIAVMKDESMKTTLIDDYKIFMDGILKYQDEKTGIWYNIVDETTETLPGNYLETSGTAMFAYSLLAGYNMGFASEEYRDAGLKAFNGLCAEKVVVAENGVITINDIYMKSGVETEKALYLRHETVPNEAKGTAFVIMTAVEAQKMVK